MIDVLNNLMNNSNYDSYNIDYLKKMENKNYQMFLKDVEQLSINDFKNFVIANNDQLMQEINNIKKEVLYDSIMHGISHNIKVLLFAFYLSKKLNLNDTNFRIIMDACKYHDVGRVNDLYDESHGKRSADAIGHIVNDKIYANQDNLDMLKAIIELHSIPDRNVNKIISKYHINNQDDFKILASILKDADALDRVRLSLNNQCFSELNPRYLRIAESLSLVQVAHVINAMYMEYFKNDTIKCYK